MKPRSTPRTLRVSWHARSWCALRLYPTRFPAAFRLLFETVLLLRLSFLFHGRLPRLAAQFRRISTPPLPCIEFP
jgi:hypothetical protein